MGAGSLLEQGEEALDPAVNGAPLDDESALGEPLHDIGVAQAIADVSAHCQRAHIIRESVVREGTRRASRKTAVAIVAAPALAAQSGLSVLPRPLAPTPNALHGRRLLRNLRSAILLLIRLQQYPYIRVGSVWKYLYRAIDREGNLVDSLLSEHRDMDAAKRFFAQGAPAALEVAEQALEKVTTDGHDSYPRAVRETLGEEVMHRCNPYLNNRLEQDHRGVKQRYYPMRGFESFDAASRFCRAFDEQRQYFRLRPGMGQPLPPLAEQRRDHRARFQVLMGELMAA